MSFRGAFPCKQEDAKALEEAGHRENIAREANAMFPSNGRKNEQIYGEARINGRHTTLHDSRIGGDSVVPDQRPVSPSHGRRIGRSGNTQAVPEGGRGGGIDRVVGVEGMGRGSGGIGKARPFGGRVACRARYSPAIRDNGEEDDEERLMASIARLDTLLRSGGVDAAHEICPIPSGHGAARPSAAVSLGDNPETTPARSANDHWCATGFTPDVEARHHAPEISEVMVAATARRPPRACGMNNCRTRRRVGAELKNADVPNAVISKTAHLGLGRSEGRKYVARMDFAPARGECLSTATLIAPGVVVPLGAVSGGDVILPAVHRVSPNADDCKGNPGRWRYPHDAGAGVLDRHHIASRAAIDNRDMGENRNYIGNRGVETCRSDKLRGASSAGTAHRRPDEQHLPASAPSPPRGD